MRGRGLGVLSCPITSVPFILHGMGGEGGTRLRPREDGENGGGGITEMVVHYCQIGFITQRDRAGLIIGQ